MLAAIICDSVPNKTVDSTDSELDLFPRKTPWFVVAVQLDDSELKG